MRRAWLLAGAGSALAALTGPARAEEPAASADPAAPSDWPSIIVTAPAGEARALPPQIILPPGWLVDRQPRSAADVLRGIAGVSVRTNSRGETIARVRGAEERQTQVFLDGAPLAVPWDGRVDLGLLPAGLLGGVRVVKGASPIEYGANAIAGVVDLQTRTSAQGHFGVIEAGSLGSGSAALVFAERVGGLETTLALGGITRDAEPLAGALPFSQPDSARRTNTDLDAASLFAALGGEQGALRWRASVLHLDAERGIAPEGDRPASAGARFWRYPAIALTQATLNGALALGGAGELRAVGWRQWFGQTIAQFRGPDFAALRAEQHDEDDTLGGRITLTHAAGPLTLRWAASAQSSTHRQIDRAVPAAGPAPRLTFRQNLLSAGLEADAPLGRGLRLTLGGAYDRAETPLTGDKPARAPLAAGAFSAALSIDLAPDMALTLSAGRRTRFPSARELFGEALGRFAASPDLAPEQAWLADAEWRWEQAGWSVVINPFVQRSEDTLSQRVLADGRRQRFNLQGALSYGADLWVRRDVTERLRLEFSASALSARADAGDVVARRLPQRPAYEALAALDWNLPERFDIRAELRAVGSAADLDAAGAPITLPAGAELSLRAAVPLVRLGQNRLWLTGAIENVTDTQIFPQAGLPLPGRLWRIGLRFD